MFLQFIKIVENLETYISAFFPFSESFFIPPSKSKYNNFDVLDDKYFVCKKRGLYKISFFAYVNSLNGTSIHIYNNDLDSGFAFLDSQSGDGNSRTLALEKIIELNENDKLSFRLFIFKSGIKAKNISLTVNCIC